MTPSQDQFEALAQSEIELAALYRGYVSAAGDAEVQKRLRVEISKARISRLTLQTAVDALLASDDQEPTTPDEDNPPESEVREIKNRSDVILPPSADPAKHLGSLTGDTDPQHNLPLPAGTKWKDGTPYYAETTPPVPEPEPSPTQPTQPQPPIIDTSSGSTKFGSPKWESENWEGNVEQAIRAVVDQASDDRSVVIAYDIPGRDNGNYSAGGRRNAEEYKVFTRKVQRGIGDAPADIILEPDSLGLINHLSQSQQDERIDLLQDAIDTYGKGKNTRVYVDLSMWLGTEEALKWMRKLHGYRGFALNTSNFNKTEQCIAFGDPIAKALNCKYVIDTSRNGVGNPRPGVWCNPTDVKVGVTPTTETASPYCDAYIHGKVAGESDGKEINGQGWSRREDVPDAGVWWPEYAEAVHSGEWTAFKARYGIV